MVNITNKADLVVRKLFNKATYPLYRKKVETFYKEAIQIDNKSNDYFKYLMTINDSFSAHKDVLCNFEDGVFDKIVSSDMPVIFIMNHSNQKKDPQLLSLLSNMLNLKYIEAGKGNTCPRPKFIMNENIILAQPKLMQELYKKFGAVGINIFEPKYNSNVLKELITSFIKGESNIFIFPEGKNCIDDTLPIEVRFKTGVAKIIKTIMGQGKGVKVVPVGFSYGKSGDIYGSMFVGNPVYFRKRGTEILTNSDGKIKHINTVQDVTNHLVKNIKKCIKESTARLNNPDNISL